MERLKADTTILIFTTTYKSLYKRDFLSLCCKGIDEIVRWGYAKRHLASDFSENPQILQGKVALIVFAEYIEGSDEYRYHPVRYACVNKIEDQTDSVSIELELRSFYAYGSNPTDYSSQHKEIFESIDNKPLTKTQKQQNQSKSHFIIKSADVFPKNNNPNEPRDWKNLVNYVSKLEDLRDVTFFRQATELLQVKSITDKTVKIDLRQLTSPPSPLILQSGETHSVKLKIFPGPEADINSYPELKVDSIIANGGPYIRQDGADLIECTYLLVPSRTFSTAYSPLSIKIKEPDEKELVEKPPADSKKKTKKIRSPHVENFVIVKPPNMFTWLVVILFILGFSLPDIAEFVVPKFTESCLGLGREISLTLDVLAVVFLILASYLGFKKLPLK